MRDFCYISVIAVLMLALCVSQKRETQAREMNTQMTRLCETSTRLLDARIVELYGVIEDAERERVRLLGLTPTVLD